MLESWRKVDGEIMKRCIHESKMTLWHFTSTLEVTSHKINACFVFALGHISARNSVAPCLCDQLSAKDTDVRSLPSAGEML